METIKESLAIYLQDLVKNNRQSIEVYNKASEAVNNVPMAMLFDRLRQQRLYFENILERMLEEQGSEVEEEFNLHILARKIWLDIRTLMVYRNEYDILAEIIKAETRLKNSIEELLTEGDLDEGDKKIIRTQLKIISADLRNIEKLQAEYSDKLGINY
jgi:uncharacterized protein (TIGR02284 family)